MWHVKACDPLPLNNSLSMHLNGKAALRFLELNCKLKSPHVFITGAESSSIHILYKRAIGGRNEMQVGKI